MRHAVSVAVLSLGLVAATACNKAGKKADALKERALAQMNAGHVDSAIALFDSAVQVNPADADAYYGRGNAYAAKRDHDRAIANYDSAIVLRPALWYALRNRGVSYSAKFDFKRALQDFDSAIALKPDYAKALNSRGFARQMTGDYVHALEDYDRAIALSPVSAVAYRNRANVRFMLGRFGDAAADLERAVGFTEAATPRPARFDESGGYAVVWLHLARLREGADDSVQFAANAERVDSAYWPRPVVSFFQGKLTGEQLVAQTAAVADPKLRDDQRCGAEFFAGEAAIARKQLAQARSHLTTMRTTCSPRFIEHAVAVADLARLDSIAR